LCEVVHQRGKLRLEVSMRGDRDRVVVVDVTANGQATRRTGRFEYQALLPAGVKADEIKATPADGVLTVTVPKAQAAKPRHIEITPD